jgi:hypothetical protein
LLKPKCIWDKQQNPFVRGFCAETILTLNIPLDGLLVTNKRSPQIRTSEVGTAMAAADLTTSRSHHTKQKWSSYTRDGLDGATEHESPNARLAYRPKQKFFATALSFSFCVLAPVCSLASAVVAGSFAPQGSVVGFVISKKGVAKSSAQSGELISFQEVDLGQTYPISPAYQYGANLVYPSATQYTANENLLSLTETLQQKSNRLLDMIDCGVALVPQSSRAAWLLPPVPAVSKGKLRQQRKDSMLQVLTFNNTAEAGNNTFFSLRDVDISNSSSSSSTSATGCISSAVGPAVADQTKAAIGRGYAQCITHSDKPVKAGSGKGDTVERTVYAVVMHDWYQGLCTAPPPCPRCSNSCHRLVSLVTYSDGTPGKAQAQDLHGWPDGLEMSPMAPYNAGPLGCYHVGQDSEPSGSQGLLMLMAAFRSNHAAMVSVDPGSGAVRVIRNLGLDVRPSPFTVMNVEGNLGFISYDSLMVYSAEGTLLLNRTLDILGGIYPEGYPRSVMQNSIYRKAK